MNEDIILKSLESKLNTLSVLPVSEENISNIFTEEEKIFLNKAIEENQRWKDSFNVIKKSFFAGVIDRDVFEKAWSTDLQKRFPNGGWRTVNGARVFINCGKVVAGLNGFNGEIDKFFKEKEAKSKSKQESKPKRGDRIYDNRKEKWGTIRTTEKPKKGSALENEPYVMNITFDDGTSAINMPMGDRYKLESKTADKQGGDNKKESSKSYETNKMKIKDFLTENRTEVISYFNNEVSNYWTISLKDFMIDLMKNFRKISTKEEYTRMDLMGNLQKAKSRLGMFDKTNVEVVYTKPYRENIFISESSKRQLPSSMR